MYVYLWVKHAGCYTVGHYDPKGKWEPESDHATSADAAARVHYLNGGKLTHTNTDAIDDH